jgi:hypothetical protein
MPHDDAYDLEPLAPNGAFSSKLSHRPNTLTAFLNRLISPGLPLSRSLARRRLLSLLFLLGLVVLTSVAVISLTFWRRQPEYVPPWNRDGLTCQERIHLAKVPEADPHEQYTPGKPQAQIDAGATVITAQSLLDGTYPANLITSISRSLIIHQSWKTHNASGYPLHDLWHSQDWWIAAHPGWVYVLWDNNDNHELVKRKYPELLDVFEGFKHEIARADFSRPLYMHAFGGVYSDLDVLPVSTTTFFLSLLLSFSFFL